jgi:prevent-host-death family protein
MHKLTATALKNRIGATLNEVEFRGERVILQRQGRLAAAIIPIADLRLLEELEDRMDVEEIERVLADPNEKWYSLEEVLAESERLP